MGYRSDVTVIMYADTKEEQLMVNEWVKMQLAKHSEDWGDNFHFLPNMVRFDAENWKWYDSYEEIQWLEKLFADYKEAFCGNSDATYAIEFARVGEDYADIEVWDAGASEGRLYVVRSIRVD